MISTDALSATLAELRRRAPLVHNITSAVVANFTANALLALGASPAMVESEEEVAGFAARADALVINLGSLTPARAVVMRLAIAGATNAGTPWVLDPVAAGAIAARTAFARELCVARPAAIRGNASEIRALAGHAGGGRGVDTVMTSDLAVDAAKHLALRAKTIVAVTGATDYVTDGRDVIEIAYGHPMMTRVTGMGCAASAIVAACLGSIAERLDAVSHAIAVTGLAGQKAAAIARGPGSLALAYLDMLAASDLGGKP